MHQYRTSLNFRRTGGLAHFMRDRNLITDPFNLRGASWNTGGNGDWGTGRASKILPGCQATEVVRVTSATGESYIRQATTAAVTTTYTSFVVAEAGNQPWARVRNLWAKDSSVTTNVWFNLSTGQVGTIEAEISAARMIPLGYKKWLLLCVGTSDGTVGNNYVDLGIQNADNSVDGAIGDTIIYHSAKLVLGNWIN